MGEAGMNNCSELPLYTYEGIKCNASAKMYTNNTPTEDSCVNWNQYYTSCLPGDKNPFKGAISFDNIGLAWVAIFQVSLFSNVCSLQVEVLSFLSFIHLSICSFTHEIDTILALSLLNQY